MKKSLLLILLLTTSGCDIIGFNRGANYIEPLKFKYDYDKKTRHHHNKVVPQGPLPI